MGQAGPWKLDGKLHAFLHGALTPRISSAIRSVEDGVEFV
jgi:hypothetical protein